MRMRRALWVVLPIVVAGAALAVACTDATTNANANANADADANDDANAHDAGIADAAGDARHPLDRDANGPGAADASCSFNDDCQLGLRCECAGFDCTCSSGARGTGAPGAACNVGEDCASAVCVDGPNGSMLCSDECDVDLNCPESLPICSDIAGVGRICIRTPPK